MVAAGAYHTVALRDDGQAVAWGSNEHGQCNIPPTLPWIRFVQVAAGKFHTVLIQSDGQAVASGLNDKGQCNIPELPTGLSYVRAAAGASHTVLLRSDDTVAACGLDEDGQCSSSGSSSEQEEEPLQKFKALAAGHWHTVLLRQDGRLVVRGLNNFGQCSLPNDPAEFRYIGAAAGTFHTVLLQEDGRALALGLNNHGQSNLPELPQGFRYTAVAAGTFHTVLLRDDGQAVACGQNDEGQCNIPELLSGCRYVALAVGGLHTVLLQSDGRIITCGPVCGGQCAVPELPAGRAYVSHLEPGTQHVKESNGNISEAIDNNSRTTQRDQATIPNKGSTQGINGSAHFASPPAASSERAHNNSDKDACPLMTLPSLRKTTSREPAIESKEAEVRSPPLDVNPMPRTVKAAADTAAGPIVEDEVAEESVNEELEDVEEQWTEAVDHLPRKRETGAPWAVEEVPEELEVDRPVLPLPVASAPAGSEGRRFWTVQVADPAGAPVPEEELELIELGGEADMERAASEFSSGQVTPVRKQLGPLDAFEIPEDALSPLQKQPVRQASSLEVPEEVDSDYGSPGSCKHGESGDGSS
ncbi:unnamed protein product [Polarella glacialis]|uniref:Uncharacterized protein n=1 Tax=Polarella glacialis TaxID=89957 RepID=A0A813DG52_POLGL|nr:unnamed protein product [Polarella glacialis]CAE8721572.1 unnamed protein product [Polarella glacialis]